MDYFYSDEEESFSEFEEEDYIVEEEEEFKQKIKKKIEIVKKDGFDEDYFDYQVAKSILQIHRKNDNDFSNWVNDNLKHLEALYKLSNISCEQSVFYSYVYENSFKK